MTYRELTVLIPCHSLEDFPSELPEDQAAGLLNAFACAWHPALLASARRLPGWDRSDEPPENLDGRLVLIPEAAKEWLPSGWAGHARLQGAVVVEGARDREEILRQALEPLGEGAAVDPELAADFLALGTCWLQMELLTRQMHHYSNLDEMHLERETVAAAERAVASDAEGARQHLKNAFEDLLEARERFYPVDCYILDLCLLIPRIAEEQRAALERLVSGDQPVSFICPAEDWQAIAENSPELAAQVREAWEAGRIDLVGGDLREAPLPMLPLGSVLWEFHQGQATFRRLFDRVPTAWGRRRYGLSSQLPQILKKFGVEGALHVVMDDGLYPEEDSSKVRWEGCDGTAIDAVCRFPLTAEGAVGFLRFPVLMAESMERDQSAAVLFARWPEVKSPWLGDLQRAARYAPALGRFVTLAEYFERSDDPGRISAFDQREYFPPFFIQTAARQLPDPISRFTTHTELRHRFESAAWCAAMAKALRAQPIDESDWADAERAVEFANPDADEPERRAAAEEAVSELTARALWALASVVLPGAPGGRGLLLVNTLAATRTEAVDLSRFESLPAVAGPVKAVQADDRRRVAVIEVPGSGFVWLPADGAASPSQAKSPPMVEEQILRNEFFEVHINPATGGIARVKNYGRSPNRLSQQLAYRFPHERTIAPADEHGEAERTYYSEMRCRDLQITSTGPAVGEVVTHGSLLDPTDGTPVADYRQTVRVWRHRRVFDVDIELELARTPSADPWTNYFAVRWAWNDEAAALTRTVQQGAHGFRGERFESADYLEIASDEERTTLLFEGVPFHRKTGHRMLDTLLITQGETRRRFAFQIAVDEPYPLGAARAALTPLLTIPTESGPPRTGGSGWFFHTVAKNVQVLGVLPARRDESEEAAGPVDGLTLRLWETEGRSRQVRLRCFRAPASARVKDFSARGHTLATLAVEGDTVLVPMSGHEIADVEIRFSTGKG